MSLVYAGSGMWVDRGAWNLLLGSPTDSMFCRAAAMVYWTPEELRNRSVTGALSNKYKSLGRTEAKPALSPAKVSSLKALFHVFMGDVGAEGEEVEASAEAPVAEAGRHAA
ncbi:BEN domain-containing protein 5-like [Amblyomma americanum]